MAPSINFVRLQNQKSPGGWSYEILADQYGKHFKVNIGQSFDVAAYPATVEGKSVAITDLRDTLAALKWEIWETNPTKRAQLSGAEWNEYVEERFKEWPYFNKEYIQDLIYHPKGVTQPGEAFAFLDKLIPSRESAFLIREACMRRRNLKTN